MAVLKIAGVDTHKVSYSPSATVTETKSYFNLPRGGQTFVETNAPNFAPDEVAGAYTQYNPSNNYSAGDKVYQLDLWQLYQSKIDNNNKVDLNYWIQLGAMNPMRCLDSSLTSSTKIDSDELWYIFDYTMKNGISLQGLENVSEVSIEVSDYDDNIYIDESFSIADFGVKNLWEHINKPVSFKERYFINTLTSVNRKIKITFTRANPSNYMEIGLIGIGNFLNIGDCLLSSSTYQIDSRNKYESDTDEFGDSVGVESLIDRGFIERFTAEFSMSPEQFESVKKFATSRMGAKFNIYSISGALNYSSINMIGQHYSQQYTVIENRQPVKLDIISLKGGD